MTPRKSTKQRSLRSKYFIIRRNPLRVLYADGAGFREPPHIGGQMWALPDALSAKQLADRIRDATYVHADELRKLGVPIT
jgi:hypothetical protein